MRRTLSQRRRSAGAGALLLLAALAAACGDPPPAAPALPPARIGPGPHDVAVLTVRDLGVIRIELLPEIAPQTVANFEALAKQGFYDGTYFHRVIPGFMIQGGDPNTKDNDPRNDGRGGPETNVPDEFTSYSHRRGVVSMANRGTRNSGGSQFFILQRDVPQLDGHYAAFGRVTEGMDVVDAITRLEIDVYGRYGPRNRPYPVSAVIDSIRIEPAA